MTTPAKRARAARKHGMEAVTATSLELYDFEMHVVVGPWKGLEGYARWHFDSTQLELQDCCYHALHLCKRGYPSLVWMPRRPRTAAELSTLSHEILHVVRRLFEWIEIPLNKDTDEAYCYALGHLVKDVLVQLGCRNVRYDKETTANS